jgi:hypothetical protein
MMMIKHLPLRRVFYSDYFRQYRIYLWSGVRMLGCDISLCPCAESHYDFQSCLPRHLPRYKTSATRAWRSGSSTCTRLLNLFSSFDWIFVVYSLSTSNTFIYAVSYDAFRSFERSLEQWFAACQLLGPILTSDQRRAWEYREHWNNALMFWTLGNTEQKNSFTLLGIEGLCYSTYAET